MSYACKTLADSIGPHGIRLTTLEVTFPRPYLAEFNTHRRLSRNSASSRAIPTEEQIERVLNHPYIPEFRERVKGMGGGVPLTGMRRTRAQCEWLKARDNAVESARRLLSVAKDDANRLIEPFMWQTVIVSATEWDNFLNLRDHEDAALPMQRIARMMRAALDAPTAEPLNYGDWHLPLVFQEDTCHDRGGGVLFLPKISAGRCARVSYDRQHDAEPALVSVGRWNMLSSRGHWSPGEHPAKCFAAGSGQGNFDGWLQLRKYYAREAVFAG